MTAQPRPTGVTYSSSQGMGDVAGKAGDATATTAEFEFQHVSQYFFRSGHAFAAVEGINLRLLEGKFIAIIGPSGCGKSTLLNMAAGLLWPSKGRVRYRGEVLSGPNTDVGYMRQQDHLLPWRTVKNNVGLALEIKGVNARVRDERVAEALELVNLTPFADAYPAKLSGGMRKRVALARTLISNPSTLLMDEPFAALDAQLRVVMQNELLRLWERERKTVLFVTHDLDEAIALADEVVVFSAGPGRIIHVEPIDISRPRDVTALRGEPQFHTLWTKLWSLLHDQSSIIKE